MVLTAPSYRRAFAYMQDVSELDCIDSIHEHEIRWIDYDEAKVPKNEVKGTRKEANSASTTCD